MTYTYEYPRPALTVDCVVFGFDPEDADLQVMLIQRDLPPFKGRWALPGGFVHIDEELEDAARRELREETGVEDLYLEQLYTVGTLGRDPRERVVTVAYFALVKMSDHTVQAATDAADAAWFNIHDIPTLAFDHHRIFQMALDRLRGKVRYKPIGFELLPELFTLTQLQHVYEAILGTQLDKRNFRRKVQKTELVLETGEVQKDVAHRAAQLYRFDKARYRKLEEKGFNFEI